MTDYPVGTFIHLASTDVHRRDEFKYEIPSARMNDFLLDYYDNITVHILIEKFK